MNRTMLNYFNAYAECYAVKSLSLFKLYIKAMNDPHRISFYYVIKDALPDEYEEGFLKVYNKVKYYHLEDEVFSLMRDNDLTIWQAAKEWDVI